MDFINRNYIQISEKIKIKIRTAKVKFLISFETNLKVIYWLLTQKIY